jgi:RNA polymerase sigma-70 factor (ECF subfamily)
LLPILATIEKWWCDRLRTLLVATMTEAAMPFDFHAELTLLLPHMRAFARSLTGDADRADDLVQDTILRALNARAQFQPGTHFRAWVFTILRNHWVSQLRRRPIAGPSLDEEGAPEFGRPGDQHDVLMLADLRRALSRMSPDHREVLLLVGANGFSYEEAAAVCGCAVGTVKSRVSRARRELLRDLEGVPAPAAPTGVSLSAPA